MHDHQNCADFASTLTPSFDTVTGHFYQGARASYKQAGVSKAMEKGTIEQRGPREATATNGNGSASSLPSEASKGTIYQR